MNRTIWQDIGDWFSSTTGKAKSFFEKYDAESWPAFFVFLGVVTLGMVLNYFGFKEILGQTPALLISLLFEAALVAWKMTTARSKNGLGQNRVAVTATWASFALACAMIYVNLFRVGGDGGFETTAYIIVGVTAALQVVFYLLFDQLDADKSMKRESKQSERQRERRGREVDIAMDDINKDMDIMRKVRVGLQEVVQHNQDLPEGIRKELLKRTAVKLLAQMSDKKDQEKFSTDIDKMIEEINHPF